MYMFIEQIHVYSSSILSRAAVDPPEKCYFEWRFADGPITARATLYAFLQYICFVCFYTLRCCQKFGTLPQRHCAPQILYNVHFLLLYQQRKVFQEVIFFHVFQNYNASVKISTNATFIVRMQK